jgi:hypothetical protein
MRFSVIGQLLAAPAEKGELKRTIEELASRTWRHPTTGEPVRFGFSTIERWYYRALRERSDPVGVLRRKIRADAGQQAAVSEAVRRAILAQYAAHKSWSVKLHHDNLVALAEARPDLQPVPSYPTLLRFMRANGLDKRRRLTPRRTDGAERAEARIVEREVRRYEAEYVNGLWHWDCHYGSRKVLTARGEWVTPILFGVLDDRSRLACHLQWYLSETAEVIAHGLAQAFQKRGLPRAASDRYGLPPITRSTLTSVPCPLPRRIETRAYVDCFPIPRGLPRFSAGSASATSLSRPAQASLALRPTGSLDRPRRPLSQGSGPTGCPKRAACQLPDQSTTLWVEPTSTVLRAVGAH